MEKALGLYLSFREASSLRITADEGLYCKLDQMLLHLDLPKDRRFVPLASVPQLSRVILELLLPRHVTNFPSSLVRSLPPSFQGSSLHKYRGWCRCRD